MFGVIKGLSCACLFKYDLLFGGCVEGVGVWCPPTHPFSLGTTIDSKTFGVCKGCTKRSLLVRQATISQALSSMRTRSKWFRFNHVFSWYVTICGYAIGSRHWQYDDKFSVVAYRWLSASNSSALAVELLQSCAKPSIYGNYRFG